MVHSLIPFDPNSVLSFAGLIFIFTALIIIIRYYYKGKKYEAEKYAHDFGKILGRLEDFVDLFEDLKDRGHDYNARITSLENDFNEIKADIELFKMSHIIKGKVIEDDKLESKD